MKHYGTILRSQKILYAALLASVVLVGPLAARAADGGMADTTGSLLPPPSPGIAIPAPPPSAAALAAPTQVPAPPPSSAAPLSDMLSSDAAKLAAQAEKTALQAQAQAESEQEKREREHNDKSFQRAAAGLLPLAPDQIRNFMHKLEVTQEASIPPSAGPPKGEVRVATLALDPGVEPPQVNLASGFVTTITIFDASGEPWPISDVGIGGNFEVQPATIGSHVIRIIPLTLHGIGNLSVLLKDLPTPIIFRLTAGGGAVDLRYDARIPK